MLDTFTFNPANMELGFTQSELSTMSNCGMKWNLLYNHCLKRQGEFSWPLVVGDAFHDGMEQMYATRGQMCTLKDFRYPIDVILTPTQRSEEEYWRQITTILLTTYQQYYHQDFTEFEYDVEDIERTIDLDYQGFKLRGKIDLIFRPAAKQSVYIMDHKTTSRIDPNTAAGWDFRFQFMFYLWCAWKSGMVPRDQLGGFYINAVKKPQLKRKANGSESLEAFVERCRLDIVTDPDKYFYRERLPLTDGALEHFETIVLAPKLARLQLITKGLQQEGSVSILKSAQKAIALDMNTDHCQFYGKPCEFLDLCRHGWDAHGFQYTQRETKHEELDTE